MVKFKASQNPHATPLITMLITMKIIGNVTISSLER